MRLLITTLFILALGTWTAEAATRLSPEIDFEVFRRTRPENLMIPRLGGGAIFTADVSSLVALQIGGFYTGEKDSFNSGNSFNESCYRARVGAFFTFLKTSAFRGGFMAGAQYSLISQTYTTAGATPVIQQNSPRYWSPYAGVQLELIPVAGFGVREGFSIYRDEYLDTWIPQFFIGLNF